MLILSISETTVLANIAIPNSLKSSINEFIKNGIIKIKIRVICVLDFDGNK